MPPNTKEMYFCEACDYVRKAYLSKGFLNPKRKSGVTLLFSKITHSIQLLEGGGGRESS